MKKLKVFLAIGLGLGVLVAGVLVFAYSSPEREIMIMGAKDFKVDDMDQYDLNRKLIYTNTTGLLETSPPIPRAVNEEVIFNADPGLEADGSVNAHLWLDRFKFSEDRPVLGGDLGGVTRTNIASERVWVKLGDRVEFEGYTVRFVGAHIAKDGRNHVALILEAIPDNVTVFPGDDPDVW